MNKLKENTFSRIISHFPTGTQSDSIQRFYKFNILHIYRETSKNLKHLKILKIFIHGIIY